MSEKVLSHVDMEWSLLECLKKNSVSVFVIYSQNDQTYLVSVTSHFQRVSDELDILYFNEK